jgi:hypothetical protein
MNLPPHLEQAALNAYATQSEGVRAQCACAKLPGAGWQSLPLSLPLAQLQEVGTLLAGSEEDATFLEYHPDGTRYWSDDAPIAPLYYPYNRCSVWQCTLCQRSYLRYTESGGYFVDARIRALRASLVVDVPL